ncbi:MAG TPA: hypothetical protein VNU93_02050 [Verrucomicrobiae bacterium]|nr:hypothetical protein [Verrucomicrobiae bacterium]
MTFRMFMAIQFLMFLVCLLLAPGLQGIEQFKADIVLNFAVFYLAGLLVGYRVRRAPLINALVVSLMFNLLFYLVVFIGGGTENVTTQIVAADAISMVLFTVFGVWVGIRSRPVETNRDVIN